MAIIPRKGSPECERFEEMEDLWAERINVLLLLNTDLKAMYRDVVKIAEAHLNASSDSIEKARNQKALDIASQYLTNDKKAFTWVSGWLVYQNVEGIFKKIAEAAAWFSALEAVEITMMELEWAKFSISEKRAVDWLDQKKSLVVGIRDEIREKIRGLLL